MTQYRTEQESFWRGSFGDEYVERNRAKELVAPGVSLFSDVLRRTGRLESAIEFGSNIGLNLKALKTLIPDIRLASVEINHKAVEILKNDPFFSDTELEVYEQSILDYKPEKTFELALIKGVLIHINPDMLPEVYDRLYRSAKGFICVAEYYNPSPVSVNYRGNEDRLFKRDFAGELLDRYPDLRLVDYGFRYHRDPVFPDDDITWFLLEKKQG